MAIVSTMAGSPWGGSEELWAAMASDAVKMGHEVCVSVYRWPSSPPQLAKLALGGVRVLRRSRPRPDVVGGVLQRFVPSFRDLVQFAPDVICISQGNTYDAPLMADLRHLLDVTDVPVVVVCQFNDDGRTLDASTRSAALQLFTRARSVVFVAHRNLVMAERQLAVALPNACVLRNPVNICEVDPVPWPVSSGIRFASVARLEAAYKGQDILFGTLSSPVWQERDWRLRLYGEGPDRAYLQALARHYGLVQRVEFAGHVADIRALWADNHMLVLPSRAEGTPLALVEAMLCGRPAVVTDVGGNTEWIKEPRTGFVAEGATSPSLGAALERAWLVASDWKAMGERAHQAAVRMYDPSAGRSLLKIVLDAA